MKKHNTSTLADSVCDFRVRKIKKQFFTQINTLLDWQTISQNIDKYYRERLSCKCRPRRGLVEATRQVPFWIQKDYVTYEEGLVCGVVTTKASLNEVSNLEEVVESANLSEGTSVRADKGYQSENKYSSLCNGLNLLISSYLNQFILMYCTDNQVINSMTTDNKLISIFDTIDAPRSHINPLHNLTNILLLV